MSKGYNELLHSFEGMFSDGYGDVKLYTAEVVKTRKPQTCPSYWREGRVRKSLADVRLSTSFRSAPTNSSESGSGTRDVRSNAMATEPVRESVSTLSLSITLPEPVPGDPYTYCAFGANAALAIAAAMESVESPDLTDLMAACASSAEFALLKQCYRRDLANIAAALPADSQQREEFVLDLALCRMFCAGVRYAKLPREVRRAA